MLPDRGATSRFREPEDRKFDWSTEQLLVRLGIATSASSTGPMLVATDDLHPNGYMPRYMVVVLARPIFCGVLAILPTLKAGPEKMKSLLPGHRHQTLFSWFRVALPLYDPVHGSGPGEIVFRYMSVVQPWPTGSHCLLPVGGRSTPPNQVQLASSTGDDIRLLVRLVAWVMSDPVNCELMGRPVMQKEMTYVSVTVVRLDLNLLWEGGRTTPPNQVRLARTAS